jgi:hypothetical protein
MPVRGQTGGGPLRFIKGTCHQYEHSLNELFPGCAAKSLAV